MKPLSSFLSALYARRARAGALAGEMNALAEEVRAAAQAEQNLKAAYSQYQTLLRGTTLEELAALWDARAALTAARAAVEGQAAKLAECRPGNCSVRQTKPSALCADAVLRTELPDGRTTGSLRGPYSKKRCHPNGWHLFLAS